EFTSGSTSSQVLYQTPADSLPKQLCPSLYGPQNTTNRTQSRYQLLQDQQRLLPSNHLLSHLASQSVSSPLQPFPVNPLTGSQFIKHVRVLLLNLGLDPGLYFGHSFRNGAASATSQHRVPSPPASPVRNILPPILLFFTTFLSTIFSTIIHYLSWVWPLSLAYLQDDQKPHLRSIYVVSLVACLCDPHLSQS
ncbi:hypothetical protein AB205_0191810, partial [Aquarana catesbeiana]